MENTINERIKLMYERSNEKSVRSYALKINVAPTTLNECIKGAEPRFSLIKSILDGEPSISAEWLMRGVGDMEKAETSSELIEELKAKMNQLIGENRVLREQLRMGLRIVVDDQELI